MLRILLVDGDHGNARLLRVLLAETHGGCELSAVERIDEAERILSVERFDVVLLDLDLPDASGMDAFRRLQGAAGSAAIVVLADTPDDETALAVVQAGAGDYLVRDRVSGPLLWRSLRYAVERQRAIARISFQAQLLDQIGQAVVATSPDGRIEYWNAAAERLFEWHADEVVGLAVTGVMFPDSAHTRIGAMMRRLGIERSWSGELRLERKSGSEFTAEVNVTALRDDGGAVTGFLGVVTDISGRRAAEEAMRSSEQRLRMFVDLVPTLLWMTDDQMRITSVMGAALSHLGLTPGDLIGLDISTLDTENQGPARASKTRQALSGESVSFQFSWGGRHYDAQIEPLRTPGSNAVHGTIGIALDVTQRRESERATRKYFELLRTILDASPVAIVALDAEGLVTMWNRTAERMFGWTEAEVIHRPVPFIPEAGQADFDRRVARTRAGVTETVPHLKRNRRDGSIIDVAVTSAPIHDSSGKFLGTMGMIADISAQLQVEQQKERLTGVVESSPDFVGMFDGERRAFYLNRSGRQMIGDEHCDIAGRPLASFYTADSWARIKSEALPEAESGGVWIGEARLATVTGDETPVRQTLVAHHDPGGGVAFYSVASQDLTDRRRLEEQLRQSQKMDAIGRLAGGVAHDFNNLLTAIAGHTEMLLEQVGTDNPSARSDIEEVLSAVDRAAGLTRQLLAFSRRQVLQPKLLDVNGVVSDMERLLRRLIGEDVVMTTRLSSGLPPIRADRSQLEQVIMNLVVNARDAMPVGGRIDLATALCTVDGQGAEDIGMKLAAGDYVEIQVIDNGTGMDPAVLARVFEPFFTTKEQGKGTGLGLPTVYGIVTQSGGWINVDSEPGGGSTFRVLLPAVGTAPADTPEPAERSKESGGSETILLVEDESAVRRLGERILERAGYNVVSAESALAALDIFPDMQDEVSILISDVVMPGMSGGELARRLLEAKPGLRILFTSGYTADAIARHGVLEEGTSFLEKPFTPDALMRKVREVLDTEPS